MDITRKRFGIEEVRELCGALETQFLWPYDGNNFAPKLRSAEATIREIFADGQRRPCMVPTNSGASSIQVALGGLRIPAGSEVIVTPITDPGTVMPIVFHNAIPVFADIDPLSGLITPDSVEAALTPRTSAVIAVHLTGSPVDVPGIRKRLNDLGRPKVKIIEDVAQGQGASLDGVPLGMLGDAGCFSLNTFKHLSTGEGGFVLVDNEDDFHACLNHSDKHRNRFGSTVQGQERYEGIGHSMRMSELQGAMLVAQLPRLAGFAARRNAFGMAMDAALTGGSDLVPQRHLAGAHPTFFGYMFTTPHDIDAGAKAIAVDAITARIRHLGARFSGSYNHRDLPIYQYPVFLTRNFFPNANDLWPAELVAAAISPNDVAPGHYDYSTVTCTQAEIYLKRSFWIDLHEELTPEHAAEISATIIEVFGAQGLL